MYTNKGDKKADSLKLIRSKHRREKTSKECVRVQTRRSREKSIGLTLRKSLLKYSLKMFFFSVASVNESTVICRFLPFNETFKEGHYREGRKVCRIAIMGLWVRIA